MRLMTRLLGCAAMMTAMVAPAAAAVAQEAPAASAPATTTDADPALWVVRDDDTTIYLFGTVHVLRPGLSWFDEAVRDAFNASDELKIEVLLPDNPQEMGPAIMRYAVDPNGRTLTSRLTPEQAATYTQEMTELGIPAQAVDQFEPWFVSLTVATVMMQRMGFEANAGSEAVLRQAATAANKPVTAFETVDDQLGFLDSTPETEQISGLLTALTEMDQARTMFDTLVTKWAAGDPDGAGAIMNESLASTPETGRIMLTDRNRRWADALQARMAQPGTLFVAVGAGHLMGNNSVQHFLAERGLTATRVNY